MHTYTQVDLGIINHVYMCRPCGSLQWVSMHEVLRDKVVVITLCIFSHSQPVSCDG